MNIIVAIIIFGMLVFFHELGHFLLAKKNGIRVEEFSIGMGPKLWHYKKGDTDYCIKALPLGGSCMMTGEDSESTDENAFHKKSVWARMSVVLAGPIFNFILAFFLSMFVIGMIGVDKPVLGGVTQNSGAEAAGLQAGDRIVKLNNTSIHIFSEALLFLQTYPSGEPVTITYERDGVKQEATVTPKQNEEGRYLYGIEGGAREKVGFFDTIGYSFYQVIYFIKLVFKSFAMIFAGQVSMNQMAGPVGIVKMIGDSYEQAHQISIKAVFVQLANFSALLSANLGVMNLLPIPALDGGRFLFLLVEAIRRKKISTEKEGMIHFAGFCLLMLLMVFLFANDIRMIFMK